MDQRSDPVRLALRDLGALLAGPDRPASPSTPRRGWRWWQAVFVPVVLLLLVSLTFAGSEYLKGNRDIPESWSLLLSLGATVPAAVALRYPLWAWRLAYPFLYLGTVDTRPHEAWPWQPVQIIFFLLVLLLLAARVRPGMAVWAGVLSLPPVYLFTANTANAHGVVVLFAALLTVGGLIRRVRLSKRALREQTELSELEKARRAVLEERARIAREMHDVVAHHMSMIAVQAETAPYRLADLPEPARAEFVAVAGAARAALTDMRRLLGVLRNADNTPQTAPQPGLADLPELVANARRAGMTVTVGEPLPDGREPAVPDPVALAAYRITQEALANAARHAPGGAVRLAVRATATELAVRIDNALPDPAPPPGPVGHGLTGMRERAVLLGGTFSAGPTTDGFTVDAHLPYEPEEGDT
ncbi:sensor histidine kinase [Plantactinospora sp. GCM10030261]|uniref:sensor histidine kinase n=1 Tax=Plantactinospora sp. GCM10030261 TaxID=3273420 RepID=UPI00360EBA85